MIKILEFLHRLFTIAPAVPAPVTDSETAPAPVQAHNRASEVRVVKARHDLPTRRMF
jgi:hypothetical protein